MRYKYESICLANFKPAPAPISILNLNVSSLSIYRFMSMSIQPYAGYLNEIRLQQRLLPSLILHFDPNARGLQAWFWYVANCTEG